MSIYTKKNNGEYVVWTIRKFKDLYHLMQYQIKCSEGEITEQVAKESISYTTLEEAKTNLQNKETNSNVWRPFDGKKVLFIQLFAIVDSEEQEELVYNKRDLITDKLEAELAKTKNGEWFASDDGNTLFFVKDEDKALESAYKIIEEMHLEKNTLIAKRTYIKDGEWFYEVMYPLNYSGKFNAF